MLVDNTELTKTEPPATATLGLAAPTGQRAADDDVRTP